MYLVLYVLIKILCPLSCNPEVHVFAVFVVKVIFSFKRSVLRCFLNRRCHDLFPKRNDKKQWFVQLKT